MLSFHQVLLPLLLALSTSFAAIYENISQIPQSNVYDYVIVGGGIAGNVLANRLSEDNNNSVLLLEAGGPYDDALIPHIPFWTTRMPPMYRWNFTSVPQDQLNDTEISYPRGFILGGSSSINGMFYTRGSSEDFDRFAEVTGDEGWNWDNLLPYFLKSEKWVPPADNHNTTGEFNPKFHNTKGMVGVSLPGFKQSLDDKVIAAGQQLGDIFEFDEDQNDGNNLGLTWNTATIDRSNRSSSAMAYLSPPDASRSNLHVLLNARVSRVLSENGDWSFRSVEYVQDLDGPFFYANATKEVILSTGVFGTPQILLNSGIGNKTYLESIHIEPLVDLPGVGQNLTDHPSTSCSWYVNSSLTWDSLNRNQTAMDEAFEEWATQQAGPLVDTIGNHLVFFRLNESTLKEAGSDPSAGPNSPHLELIIANGLFNPSPPPTGNFMGILINLLNAESRGSLLLNDTDLSPFALPIINPQFLHAKFDRIALREGVKTAFRFINAPAFDGYVLEFNGNLLNGTLADELIDKYISLNTATGHHPIGTASMSPRDSGWGVVDPDLRVKGITGLRIVDASILPYPTSGHPMSVIYAIAERAADLIKTNAVCVL